MGKFGKYVAAILAGLLFALVAVTAIADPPNPAEIPTVLQDIDGDPGLDSVDPGIILDVEIVVTERIPILITTGGISAQGRAADAGEVAPTRRHTLPERLSVKV